MSKTNQPQTFAKEFLYFCRHRDFAQTIDDFLTLLLCGLARGTQEPLYYTLEEKYTKEVVYSDIARIIALLVVHYNLKVTSSGGWTDPLGELWEEYSSSYGRKMAGEFYTPYELCNILAQLTIQDIPTETVRVLDPACGSGRTLLAASKVSPQMNYWIDATAVDINRITTKMCAVNMFFHGVRGRVIHGDTLALKAWGGYYVRPALNRIDFVSAEVAQSWLVTVKETVTAAPPKMLGGAQLTMF